MIDEIEFLKKELKIYNDFYEYKQDDEKRITSLSLHDHEYWEFEDYEGNLLEVLSNFTKLNDLHVSFEYILIKDLEPIRKLTELTSLDIESPTEIEDISALSHLTKLEHLAINSTGISDISVLSHLPNLKSISLQGNKIKDISVLSGHKNLTRINLSFNQLSDISALSSSKGLKILIVNNNQITDLSFVSELKELETLYAQNNLIEDISFIEPLTEIKVLDLSNNPIKSINPLSNQKNIISLQIADIPVDDLLPLKEYKNIRTLKVGPVKNFDVSSIACFNNLTALQLKGCNISDLNFLAGLEKLHYLNLDDNQVNDTDPLLKMQNLSYLGLRNNKIDQPFLYYLFNRLGTVDLRNNLFGKKLFSNQGIGYGQPDTAVLLQLIAVTGDYYYDKGDEDKALVFYNIDGISKRVLRIYLNKLLHTEPADRYLFKYYVARYQDLLRPGKLDRNDPEVQEMLNTLTLTIEQSDIDGKETILDSFKVPGNNWFYDYNREYAAYLRAPGSPKKINPEMLYRLMPSSLKNENLMKALSLYKQAVELNDPIALAIYLKLKELIKRNFGGTPEQKEERDKCKTILENIEDSNIPFFDTVTFFTDGYRPSPPKAPKYDLFQKTTYNNHNTSGWTWQLTVRVLFIFLLILRMAHCSN